MNALKLVVVGLALSGTVGCGAGAAECQKVQDALAASAVKIQQAGEPMTEADDPQTMKTKFTELGAAFEEEAGSLRRLDVDNQDHRLSLNNVGDILVRYAKLMNEAAEITQTIADVRAERDKEAPALKEAAAAFDEACASAEKSECAFVQQSVAALEQPVEQTAETEALGVNAEDAALGRIEGVVEALGRVESEQETIVLTAKVLRGEMSKLLDRNKRLREAMKRMEEIDERTDTLVEEGEAQMAGVKAYCSD